MNSNYKLRKNHTHKYLSLKHDKSQSSPDVKNNKLAQNQSQNTISQQIQLKPTKDYYYKNQLKNRLLRKNASKNLQSISSTSFLVRRKHFSVFYNTQKQKKQLQSSKDQVGVQGIQHVKKILNFNTNSLLNTKEKQKIRLKRDQPSISSINRDFNRNCDQNYNQSSIEQLQQAIVMKTTKNQQRQFLQISGDIDQIFKKRLNSGLNSRQKLLQAKEIDSMEKHKKESQSTIRTQTSEKWQVLATNSQSQRHLREKDFKVKKNALTLLQKNGILNHFTVKRKTDKDVKLNKKNESMQVQENLKSKTNANKSTTLTSISKSKVQSLSKDKLKINMKQNNYSQNQYDNQKPKMFLKAQSSLNLQCPQNLHTKISSCNSLKKIQLINAINKQDRNVGLNLEVSQQQGPLSIKTKQESPRYMVPGPFMKKNTKTISLKQNKANNSISSYCNISGVFQQNLNKIRSKKKELKLRDFQHKQIYQGQSIKNMTDRQPQAHKQQQQSTIMHLPLIRNFHSTQQIYFQQQQLQEIQQKISKIQQISSIQKTPTPKHMQKKENRYVQTQTLQNNETCTQQIQQDIMRTSMNSIECSTIQKNVNDQSFLSSAGQQVLANFIQNQSLQESLPQLKRLMQNKDKKRKIDIQKIRKRFPEDFFK